MNNRRSEPKHTRWPLDKLDPASCGIYACSNRQHDFLRNGSSCWLCFGDYEDPRHWLPAELQEIADRWTKVACDEADYQRLGRTGCPDTVEEILQMASA